FLEWVNVRLMLIPTPFAPQCGTLLPPRWSKTPRWLLPVAIGALMSGVGCGSSEAIQAPPVELPSVTPNTASSLGYNLDFPGDWTNLPPFIDQVANSRVPYGECSDDDPDCDGRAHLDLDDQGWPRSLRYRDDPSRSYS